MKKLLLLLTAAIVIISCNQKKKGETTKQENKNSGDTTYVVSKYGIGDVKIGMTKEELEKLLKQQLVFMHAKDTEEVWMDTASAKYKDIELSLFFQPRYNEDQNAPKEWELFGLSSTSQLCKTATGIGIGDDRVAVVNGYDDNYINMGPEYEQVNDTTWLPSKSKYNINVSYYDDDKQLFFSLLNKKIVAIGVSIAMGD